MLLKYTCAQCKLDLTLSPLLPTLYLQQKIRGVREPALGVLLALLCRTIISRVSLCAQVCNTTLGVMQIRLASCASLFNA